MMNEWLKLVRLALGNASTVSLHPGLSRDRCKTDDPFEVPAWKPPGWITPRPVGTPVISSPLVRGTTIMSPRRSPPQPIDEDEEMTDFNWEDDEIVSPGPARNIKDPEIPHPAWVTPKHGSEALLKGLGQNSSRSPEFIQANPFGDSIGFIDAALATLVEERSAASSRNPSIPSRLTKTPILSPTNSERDRIRKRARDSLWEACKGHSDEAPLQIWWLDHEAENWEEELREELKEQIKSAEEARNARPPPKPQPPPVSPEVAGQRSARITARATAQPSGQPTKSRRRRRYQSPDDESVGFERPPVYDHRGSPDCHLEPEYPAWWQGWLETLKADGERRGRRREPRNRNDYMWRGD